VETIRVDQNFAVEYIDIREGVIIDYGDGREVKIPPHSERIYLEVWRNLACEVLFYTEVQPNADPSDRIHLMIHAGDCVRRGFLMNVQDALSIVHGLTTAIQRSIAADIPLKPGVTDRCDVLPVLTLINPR